MRPAMCLSLLSLALAAAGARADDASATAAQSSWRCAFCAYDSGVDSDVSAGLGAVSRDSYKFGEYSGLTDQGGYGIADVTSRFRNPQTANFWDASVSDIALDTRNISLRGGKQGSYSLGLVYDELPHYISDSVHTPYLGDGTRHLILPGNWQSGPTTADMSALGDDLRDVTLQTKRSLLGVAAAFAPAAKWQTAINYRQESRQGQRRIAGSFYFNAVELVEPVDYTTDMLDASAAYAGRGLQAKLSYQASLFNNLRPNLTWQNPFTPQAANATQGELALPPDNQFHQLLASLTLRLGDSSSLVADIAAGRMTQNDSFVGATRNPDLATAPAYNSLQGRVDTLRANFKWNAQIADDLRLQAAYRYNDYDNRTAQRSIDWVITDTVTATPRDTTPYSFRDSSVKLNADYRLSDAAAVTAGYDYVSSERTYQESENSREQSLWAVLRAQAETTDLNLRYEHARRDRTGYQYIAGVDHPENPLLRKYNMADRNRDAVTVRLDFTTDALSTFGVSMDVAQDSYPNSSIGLLASRETSLGAEYAQQIARRTTASAYLSHEVIASDIAGSQSFSYADWRGSLNDGFDNAGVGVKRSVWGKRLDLGLDWVYTLSRSTVSVAGDALPDQTGRMQSVKLSADYHLSQAATLTGAYWFERYIASDWTRDGVGVSGIANTLSLGEETPAYAVHAITLAMSYRF